MSTDFTGTNEELGDLLAGVYVCTGDGMAIDGTGYTSAGEDEEFTADLIAWRDAAIPALTDSQHWQVGEARDILAAWDGDRGGDIYSTERTLADLLRNMLAIVDQVAPEPAKEAGQ